MDIQKSQVGILGGGQLSLMLGQAAARMGFRPLVLAEDSYCPAAQLFGQAVLGGLKHENVLRSFFSQVNVVAFENEFVDCDLIRKSSSGCNLLFFPELKAIEKMQDKIQQKEILKKLDIPSAQFLILKGGKNLEAELKECLNRFDGECILKWARMGYDGKGVFYLSPDRIEQALLFCKEAKKLGSEVFAESKIPFLRELAIIGVYSKTGEFLSYPLVISEQKNGICYRVIGPATKFGVSSELESKASSYAEKLAKEIGLVGAFALEFFETKKGELLVNEIAPRVHNSGHYTQNACGTDQFENHWRAVLGLPLGKPKTRAAFAMLNVLGPDELIGQIEGSSRIPLVGPNTFVHWYGKREIRKRRKLGHINGFVDSTDQLESLLKEMDECYLSWKRSIV